MRESFNLSAIQKAIKELNIPSKSLALLSPSDSKSIVEQVIRHFVEIDHEKTCWWWTSFKVPYESIRLDEDVEPALYLESLLPHDLRLWFFVERGPNGNWIVLEGEVLSFIRVLEHCHYFEYYFVDKDYVWLMCENHHGGLYKAINPSKMVSI